jgi:hypothetical protein
VSEKETREWRADLSYLLAAPGVTTAKPFWLRGTLLALCVPLGQPMTGLEHKAAARTGKDNPGEVSTE